MKRLGGKRNSAQRWHIPRNGALLSPAQVYAGVPWDGYDGFFMGKPVTGIEPLVEAEGTFGLYVPDTKELIVVGPEDRIRIVKSK